MKSIVAAACVAAAFLATSAQAADAGQQTQDQPPKSVKKGSPAKPGAAPAPIQGTVYAPPGDKPLTIDTRRDAPR